MTKVYALKASEVDPYGFSLLATIVISRPEVAFGRVFVGSWDGKLYALNADDGGCSWSFTTGGQIDSSPTVANDLVYVGSHDGKVYA